MAKITNNTPLNEGNLNGGFYIAFVSGNTLLDGFMAKWGETISFANTFNVTQWKDKKTGIDYSSDKTLEVKESHIFEADKIDQYYSVSSLFLDDGEIHAMVSGCTCSFTPALVDGKAKVGETYRVTNITYPSPYNGYTVEIPGVDLDIKRQFVMPDKNITVIIYLNK